MSRDQEYESHETEASYLEGEETYEEGGDDETYHDGYDPEYKPPSFASPKQPAKTEKKRKATRSLLWNKFTILDTQKYIASCNICGTHMNYRSTTTNLRKHLIRKHKFDIRTSSYVKSECSNVIVGDKPQIRRLMAQDGRQQVFRPRASQVGTIDDLVFKVVVGEDGDQHATVSILPDQVVEEPVEVEEAEYHTLENAEENHSVQADTPQTHLGNFRSSHSSKPISRKVNDLEERNKRRRILDLQLECLEMKKYNMQIETLMMEQQLNLPRSIFTETIRGSNTYTRGTQTDIGGDKTKVFYLSNKNGDPVHHFISLLND